MSSLLSLALDREAAWQERAKAAESELSALRAVVGRVRACRRFDPFANLAGGWTNVPNADGPYMLAADVLALLPGEGK